MATKEKLEILLQWFSDNEVQWEKEAIEIRESDGSFGVYALKDISKKDEAIVKIPKESILSSKTTGIANILEDEQISGGCALAIAVMYEEACGTNSPWFGYLQSLPQAEENIPIFWSDAEKMWLKGTELEKSVRQDLQDQEDDYNEIVKPLIGKYPRVFLAEHYTFDIFQNISTLVSSRSFDIDAYHERAMVPFADIFNHRGENEHIHFTTEFEVCDACGASEYCNHMYLQDLENDEHGDGKDADDQGWEDMEEDIDLENENGSDEDMEEEEEAVDEDEEEEEEEETELPDLEKLEEDGVDFWIVEKDDDTKDTCDLILDRAVCKGEEVFNTYGDLPSVALLGKYGFCFDDNKNDYVSVSEDMLVDVCLTLTRDALRETLKDADEKTLEQTAIDQTRPRWEFFLNNESVLCGTEDDDEHGDSEDEGGCCGGDHDHDHGHDHSHTHDHTHDHDHVHDHVHDHNCHHDHELGEEHGEEYDEDDEETQLEGRSRPYFINTEGLFEDTVMCLLYIMFVEERIFQTFEEDINNALAFVEQIAQSSGKRSVKDGLLEVKKKVYTACKTLVEQRRSEYLNEEGHWQPIEQDILEKEKADLVRQRYALICKIGEKRVIERSIAHYDSMVQQCSVTKKVDQKRKKGRL